MTAPRPAYVARLGLDTCEERAPLAVAGPYAPVGSALAPDRADGAA